MQTYHFLDGVQAIVKEAMASRKPKYVVAVSAPSADHGKSHLCKRVAEELGRQGKRAFRTETWDQKRVVPEDRHYQSADVILLELVGVRVQPDTPHHVNRVLKRNAGIRANLHVAIYNPNMDQTVPSNVGSSYNMLIENPGSVKKGLNP